MKRTQTIIILLTLFKLFANGQSFLQPELINTFDYVGFKSIVSNNNYIYTTGYFGPSLTFGGNTIKAKGDYDIVVSKFGTDFNPKWIKGFGSSYSEPSVLTEYGSSIAVDSRSNVYVTGLFQDTLICKDTLLSEGHGDLFLIKLDNNGDPIWAKKVSSYLQNIGKSVTIDNEDRVLITGTFQLVSNIDTAVINNPFSSKVFWIRYKSNGVLDLYKSISSTKGNISGIEIKTDASNNIYLAGECSGDLIIDSKVIQPGGDHSAFIAKYDSKGELIYCHYYNRKYLRKLKSFDVDTKGNVIITGCFSDTLNLNTTELICSGIVDIYLIKLDSEGNELWAKSFGGIGRESPNSVKFLNDDIYLSAEYSDELILGSSKLQVQGSANGFIAKLNKSGEVKSYVNYFSNWGAQGEDLIVVDNSIYITGSFVKDFHVNNQEYTSEKSGSWLMRLNGDAISNIGQKKNDSNIFLYPNPCKDILHFSASLLVERIELFNQVGVRMNTDNLIKNNTIDISKFEKGLYIVTIKTSEKIITKKIIKE